MADGWLSLADGNIYYFYADGHMAANTTIDGHRGERERGPGVVKEKES